MEYFNSEYFGYIGNELYCENVRISDVIGETGTPVYIYSKKFFLDRYAEFSGAFKEIEHSVFFAAKSNFNLNVIRLFYSLGSGVDVNSKGELYRAIKAGADPKRMLMTGVGKTPEEIRSALEEGVLFLKAESREEIRLINEIAGQMGRKAPIAIRVNPDVDPRTHPYISTGLAESKFGISSNDALDVFSESGSLPNLDIIGIDMHIGSQITAVEPFVEAVQKLADLFLRVKSMGIGLVHFDVGGGIGVRYNDELPFTPAELADKLIPIFKRLECKIIFEPGRFLTANGGILASKVLFTKTNLDKNFIVVDAAMNDLLRPSIYKAYHHIQPVIKSSGGDIKADIVGPVCESGDFLAKDREIERCRAGDHLAVMSAGAYGMVMASNYNARLRPPEVLVDKSKYYIIRKRETYEQLTANESIIEEIR